MAKEFRENFVGLLALVVLSLAIYGLVKLGTPATAAPSSNVAPAQSSDIGAADQHLVAAIYSTTEGQSSELGLNNSLNHPLTVQVTLYNKHGQALAIPPITLGAHQNHAWNIADWVRNVDGFEKGSLEVFYHGPSMALGAQETVTDANHSLSYDVHLQEPMDFMSPRADGLWWALDDKHAEAEVFVANTSAAQTTVTPTFYVGGAVYQGEAIALNGHESESIDLDKSLKKLRVRGDTSIGGISLTYTNGPGKLAVAGVISNKHTGFSTTMRFIDQEGQHTTSLHGASILIGKPEANLGVSASTRFTPHVFVRNNTNQPVQINPRIRYTLFDQPNTVTLAAVTLSPNAVRDLDLSPAINAIGSNPVADTGIEIDHAGQPGAVMAYAASTDQSGSNVFDVPVKDPKSEMGFKGGSYPWNIDGDNRAVLHVKSIDAPNDGLKREFLAKLYFDGGEYNLPLQQIEASQTAEIDIKKLRDDQVKDVLGHVIPLNVTGGQLAWYGRARKGEFIGRLVQYDPVKGTSSSFSCLQSCVCDPSYLDSWLTPFSYTGSPGDTFRVDAWELDQDCNGYPFVPYRVSGVQFYTTDPFVVYPFENTAYLTGGGQAYIYGEWGTYIATQHRDPTCEFDMGEGGCGYICDYEQTIASGATQVATVNVRWTSPTNPPAVPMSNGTAPQGSLDYVNSMVLTATGTPAGGTFSWTTSSDKLQLSNVTQDGRTSTVTVRSLKKSDSPQDVQIDLTYTYQGRHVSPNPPIRVTVQQPTSMGKVSVTSDASTTDCRDIVRNRASAGWRKDITWQVQDQFGGPIRFRLPLYDTLANNVPNSCFAPKAGRGTPLGRAVLQGMASGGRTSTSCAVLPV